jgi:hypothetical protein
MEGKKRRGGRAEMKGESVEETEMKQNLTHEDAINRQIWRKATDNH